MPTEYGDATTERPCLATDTDPGDEGWLLELAAARAEAAAHPEEHAATAPVIGWRTVMPPPGDPL